jgi:hypothetical protein
MDQRFEKPIAHELKPGTMLLVLALVAFVVVVVGGYRQRTGRLAMLATGECGFLVGMHTVPGSGIALATRVAQTA